MKTYRTLHKQLFIVLIFAVTLTNCGGPAVPAAIIALKAGKELLETLVLLRDAYDIYSNYVRKAVVTSEKGLSVKAKVRGVQVNLSSVAINWERDWKKVVLQVDALEKRLETEEDAAEAYWDLLKKVAGEIKDKELREEVEQKNENVQQKWEEVQTNAKAKVEAARALAERGKDIQMALLATALQSQISNCSKTIELIGIEASHLCSSMEVLTEQGEGDFDASIG